MCCPFVWMCVDAPYYVSAGPSLAPVSSSSMARPEQGLSCLSSERICAILTSCHCLLQFLTSILLSAFSPSIIHGWVQTFVFCLNNWLKAWSEEGECICSSKKKMGVGGMRKAQDIWSLLSFLFSLSLKHSEAVSSMPGWLKIPSLFLPLLTSHLTKWISPPHVTLFPPSTAPPLTLILK